MVTDPEYRFSDAAANLERSVLRELLGYAVDPNIISLAGGLPPSDLLPIDQFRESMDAVLVRDGARAMQYGPPFGPLRSWLAEHMNARGVSCTEENIFITSGAQQGVAVLSRMFLNPGQPAIIEEVVFTGTQQSTGGRGVPLLTVPTDLVTGIDVDAVEAAMRHPQTPGVTVVIPDFHNPLGVSITPEKRQALAALAAKYRVPVIEDDPYGNVRFEGQSPSPIKGYDEDGMCFYVGSFSKILAPAMRLGWIVAPAGLLPKIETLRESMDLETSALLQRSVTEFLARGYLAPHLDRLNSALGVRCAALLQAIDDELGDVAVWTKPQGGLFVWVTLPEHVDAWRMFKAAVDHGVVYIPGSAFSVHGKHRNTIRLSFGNVTPEAARQGIKLLAEVVRSHL